MYYQSQSSVPWFKISQGKSSNVKLRVGSSDPSRSRQRCLVSKTLFRGVLGLPAGFFDTDLAHQEKPLERSKAELLALLPESTTLAHVKKAFVSTLRGKLFQVKHAMNQVLGHTPECSHVDIDGLWNIFYRQLGVLLSKPELTQIFEYFDLDADGRVSLVELVHEMCEIDLPGQHKGATTHPARWPRKRLSPKCKRALSLLKLECELAAVRPKHLQSLFTMYDADGSGSISYDELAAMVREFRLEIKGRDSAAELMDDFSGGAGIMSYKDFATKVLTP